MFAVKERDGRARTGEFSCAHGAVQTPVFMNVGTQAAIKGGLSACDLEKIGTQVMLCNTYHLHLRPGENIVSELGGLHRFTTWQGPILTDSGGFQVFSLASLRGIAEEGVTFASHLDGHKIFMGPEESIRIQSELGADIIMAFDECVENPSPREYVKASVERTQRWLVRSINEWEASRKCLEIPNPEQHLFGINQGGTYDDLRLWHLRAMKDLPIDGIAIGGLAVGEETSVMYHILDVLSEEWPETKPRYLMGVGTPSNIIEAVYRGVDFFDCVMPSRNARHGRIFTWKGTMNLKNRRYGEDFRPLDPDCACPVCSRYSRAYLHHLFKSGEILGLRLAVMHNLYFYNELMDRIRLAIRQHQYSAFRDRYSGKLETSLPENL